MYYHSISDICFSDACLAFILAGIFCAVIRWLHVCHPYGGRRADYYYPARRQATFFFAAIVLQFPYVLHPSDAATWTYIRAFGVLYYPVCFSMLFRRYFDRHRLYSHWKGIVYILLPLAALCLLGVASQFSGERLTVHSHRICLSAGIAGFLLLLYFVSVAHQLKVRIDKFHYDNYSCEQDFPFLFAKKVVYTPLIWLAAMWLILVTGNHWVKFVVDLLFATWMVLFLAVILHPQRARMMRQEKQVVGRTEPVAEAADEENEAETDMDAGMEATTEVCRQTEKGGVLPDDAEREAVRREVTAIVRQMYRKSGLQKSEVIEKVSYGRKTLAKEYLTEVGYYNFVNAFRLKHARLYKEAHPAATLDEVAVAAGFRDRFSLNNAKNKERKSDRLLTDDFQPERV